MKNLIPALIIFSASAVAAPSVKTWTNPDCANMSCEVKAMRLYVDKFNDPVDKMAGASMAVEIETSKPEQLKKYAVVQYIKGCLFETSVLGDHRIAYREYFGKKMQPFKHTDWELDSGTDADPIYWSNPDAGYDELRGFEIPRNSYYVNDNPAVTEKYGSWAGKLSNLKTSKIFASDMPTPSAWATQNGMIQARISSLQFKICLHKISDIPARTDTPRLQVENAIVCMDWASNFHFDFMKKIFVEKNEIHKVCQ